MMVSVVLHLKKKCSGDKKTIMSELEQAGFVLNVAKSHLEPHQVADWLGFTVDLRTRCFRVPEDKVSRLKTAIQSAVDANFVVSACSLASIVGQIISMSLALGQVTHLCTRALYSEYMEIFVESSKLTN